MGGRLHNSVTLLNHALKSGSNSKRYVYFTTIKTFSKEGWKLGCGGTLAAPEPGDEVLPETGFSSSSFGGQNGRETHLCRGALQPGQTALQEQGAGLGGAEVPASRHGRLNPTTGATVQRPWGQMDRLLTPMPVETPGHTRAGSDPKCSEPH